MIAAVDKASLVLGKVGNGFKKFNKRASKSVRGVGKVLSGLRKTLFNLPTLVTGFLTAWGATRLIDAAIGKFNKADSALRGLSAVADRLSTVVSEAGESLVVNANLAKAAAIDLAEDGLLTVSDAASALKNLLLSGFGLNESIDLINATKDAAAFGRQGALSFGEAVISATEGIKNENSILVDNAGITKNLSVLQKEYAASIGKTVGQLSEAEKKTAIYTGILQEASAFQGNAAELTETYQGKVASLNASLTTLAETVGKPLTEALAPFIEKVLIPMVRELTAWVKANEGLIKTKLDKWLNIVANAVVRVATAIENGTLSAAWETFSSAVSSTVDNLTRLSNWVSENREILGILAGAAGGAKVGALFGPAGAAVGAVVGGFTGGVVANSTRADDDPQRIGGITVIDQPVITGTEQGGFL